MTEAQSALPVVPVSVLVVEDDPHTARWEKRILERAGFTVTLAKTGPDGLRLARTELPKGIVMDADLPGMSGLDVCRHLKTDNKTKYIPILVCSGNLQARELASQAGAEGFLAKPLEVAQLAERMKQLLAL